MGDEDVQPCAENRADYSAPRVGDSRSDRQIQRRDHQGERGMGLRVLESGIWPGRFRMPLTLPNLTVSTQLILIIQL